MKNILISAYACSPNMGSEPGMSWNWIINLSKYFNLYVITEGEFRDNLEVELSKLQIKNVYFVYIEQHPYIRKLCWDQGNWLFYFFYFLWQRKAYFAAKKICKSKNIVLIHQLNMIGFREPGLLWKITGIPKIWGPIGGFGGIPIRFFVKTEFKNYVVNMLKRLINKLQLFQPNIYNAFKKNDLILVANSSFYNDIPYFKHKLKVFNETALKKVNTIITPKLNRTFKLLWVGKNVYRKSLFLAIEIFKILKSKDYDVELHIIGVDNITGLGDSVHFYGQRDFKFVQKFYAECNILLFTSLHEGTPHVVLESISNGLPVICHNKDGQADVIDDKSGIKIPCISFSNSKRCFANEIESLINDNVRYKKLLQGTLIRARDLTWHIKTQELVKIYRSLIK